MKLKIWIKCFIMIAACFPLFGCDQSQNPGSDSQTDADRAMGYEESAPAPCANCGTIIDIQAVSTKGESTGAGAVIGAVVGGLLGHQVGGGSGKDAATAIGAVGGAVAGNEIEKNRNTATYYEVTVEMHDGSRRVVNLNSSQGLTMGMEVEVVGNDLRLR